MLRVTVGLAALAIGATVVLAQNTAAIKLRKDTMKALSGANKPLSDMSKGEIEKDEGGKKVKVKVPFDLAKAQASLKTLETTAIKAKAVFPDDSQGGDSKAKPEAFTNRADVLARFDKLAADAKAAQGSIKDLATFKATYPKVVANCGGCHKLYREAK
jgi:cytochrome c556